MTMFEPKYLRQLSFIALLSLGVGIQTLFAQDAGPSVRAEIAPSTAKLGDVLTLTIAVTYPNGFTVENPVNGKDLGNFEVRASTAFPLQVNGPQTTARFQVELQNFTTGPQLLPAIDVAYHDLEGASHALKTTPLPVTIQEPPAGPKDKGDIRGIKGVVGPVGWSPWWWALLAAGFLAGGFYLWTRRRQKLIGPPPPPAVPPDQAALTALDGLRATGWIESGKIKEFYSGLSEIVRTYLEKGFSVPALERTTSELMRDIRRQAPFSSENVVDLQTLLENCDLVKFAKFRPEPGEAIADHAVAVKFVQATRAAFVKEDSK